MFSLVNNQIVTKKRLNTYYYSICRTGITYTLLYYVNSPYKRAIQPIYHKEVYAQNKILKYRKKGEGVIH